MEKLDIKDFITLLKAGYTREEINAYISSEEPETSVKPAEIAPQTEPEKVPEEKPNPDIELLSSLVNEVKGMKTQMEKYFIQHDTMNITNEDVAQRILANVINPPKEK